MKKLLVQSACLSLLLWGCSPSSPSELAKQACDCNKEAKKIKNTTKQLRKFDECFRLTQRNLEELQQLGIDNDWTPEQVEKARKEFDNVYDKCSGDNNEESTSQVDVQHQEDYAENHETKQDEVIIPSNQRFATNNYDKETIEREIKSIRKKFYAINYKSLKIDTILPNEHFEADKTLVYTNAGNNVVRITELMQGANIIQTTDYYFFNKSLYFIYVSNNGTNSNPNGYEGRTYVYNNDIIKVIENGNEIRCTENCDFSLQSQPYRLLRFYLGHNY